MTKAERIFMRTHIDCALHIKVWGYTENVGFNGVTVGEHELISTRTVNALRKILESRKRLLETDLKLNVVSPGKYQEEKNVLSMVEVTLNNTKF